MCESRGEGGIRIGRDCQDQTDPDFKPILSRCAVHSHTHKLHTQFIVANSGAEFDSIAGLKKGARIKGDKEPDT